MLYYKGIFDTREVAVKRIPKKSFPHSVREVNLWREISEHSNVLTYYYAEVDGDYINIAMELMDGSMENFTTTQLDENDVKSIISQVMEGINHIHCNRIMHRDIKPQNIFYKKINGKTNVKIGDFGLSKLTNLDLTMNMSSGVKGTENWKAKEVLEGSKDDKISTKVDMFSLGLFLYYLFTKKHPFQNRECNLTQYQVNCKICQGRYNLDLDPSKSMWKHIIEKMISTKADDRPPASVVLMHPALWPEKTTKAFIRDAACFFENKKNKATNEAVRELETKADSIIGQPLDWTRIPHRAIISDLKIQFEKFTKNKKKYTPDEKSVFSLLRTIRNKITHQSNTTPEAKKLYKKSGGVTFYWTKKFPKLVLEMYLVLEKNKTEDELKEYYIQDYRYDKVIT